MYQGFLLHISGRYDKARYYASSGKYDILQDGVDENYINVTNAKVSNWFTISDLTLKTNYFKYRGNR